ncbi:MAG: SirB2 family protein [Oceanospirillaceae bacterium]|nr:SirB2 family protein [Oceanospirillaceae bacterium]
MYMALKHLHLTAITLSICLFMLRGYWMMLGSRLLSRRWVRIIPHLVDTVLLLSAIGLMLTLQQYPFVNGWLTAKLLALVVYIAFGMIALKSGRSKGTRLLAFFAALATFGYIASVAVSHDPTPWN